jgi:signal transduction histidine kinase
MKAQADDSSPEVLVAHDGSFASGPFVDTDSTADVRAESPDLNSSEQRVLILAPLGRNAELIDGALRKAGFATLICTTGEQLCDEMLQPAGAVILCEEALNRERLDCLVQTLEQQPPWSEIPLLVLTGAGKLTRASYHVAEALAPRGNATLIERPIRIITLLSAVRAALRARKRQYELRDLLDREHAARAQAEAASKAKDHFLAALSHELRTPLNPVLMTVTAMGSDPDFPEKFREDVDVIRRNVELESNLIDDLLDLTRITRGKLELHHEAIDLHTLLGYALNTCCDNEARRKQLDMRLDPSASAHFVWGDSARLAQVFLNLLRNAVKFTPAGGSIVIRTHNEPAPGASTSDDGAAPRQQVVISVTDTGIGIEPDAAARIFDAFEQENRTITRRFGGLGLGLAISKALVELHGGAISVYSAGKGAGSTFSVRLSTVHQPAESPSRLGERSADGAGKRRHILLVEDHEATASVMAKLLRVLGYQVDVAPSLARAKELLSDHRNFDLLVSDIGLPDGSGTDLARFLKRQKPIPALAVSGYGMEEDIQASREAGFQEHLVKPVDLAKLQGAIERVLAARPN